MASHGQMASDPHSDELGPRLARSREDQLQNLQAVREGTRVFTAYELRDGVCWFSWKWRNRSTVKIMERTHEEATEALHAEEKVAILRRHLLEQVPISELCDRQGLQPTVFYRWQKEFFENGAAAFEPKARPNHSAEQERIDYLEKKIQTKDEVLAELMAEHVALKKEIGEL